MDEEKKGVCRVCLSTTKRKYVSLFQKRKHSYVFDHINSIADVHIRKDDGLPDKICRGCLSDLDTAICFKQKCEGSNLILLKSITRPPSVKTCPAAVNDIVIKKEEPLESADFLEVSKYLEDHHFLDDSDTFGVYVDVKPETKLEIEEEQAVRKSKAVDEKLQCDDCKEYFKSKCKLRVHWNKIHLLQKLVCSECKRRFKSVTAYTKHQKNQQKSCQAAKNFRIEGEGKNRVFYCKECEYKTLRIKDIMTHWVIHTGDRPFKCDLCPTTCTQQSSLMAHKESAHNEYKVETTCQYCGKSIKGRNRIYRHLKLHTEKSVQCQVCNKTLKNKTSLAQHMQRHSGTKSYTCEKCAKSFYTIAELSNHKRTIHNKGKIWHKCDLCEYKSSRKETIKRHKSKHTDTNIPCTICGMFLENAQKLLLHQRRHFEEKKYSCPFCELKFFRRDTVPKHIKTKHAVFHANQQTNQVQVKTISLIVKEENIETKYAKYEDSTTNYLQTDNSKKLNSPVDLNDGGK